ncbi:hypothetical protein ERO13_A09G183700v2 [Gossypium hirsutum]|uniref:Uncharacterized protein n=1 Tax=Gossypium hirsutum TaxID=3635 RepID=A0A1U8LVL8_GOSHI|nr:uncharacterized protein LOC107930200 [Gossypium hirsutum]KAG4184636.1 hypothetical protein ERO13_A09G183700v2 [Gossypium hirsutum]
MVKLASARESRTYGPRLAQSRAEYMNAGLYLFSTIVLICGFAAEFSREPRSGLVLMLIALGLIILVNIHDLLAHLAGIDYRFTLMGFDPQLALVEFSVPLVQILGSLLLFLGILFLFIQAEKGYGFFKLERHALGMLVAGPVLWVVGSIHNSCQIYERADAHVQILQQSVHIPFLIGSVLFMVGAILNGREQTGVIHHGLQLLGKRWVWLGICGSVMFMIGGLTNVVKVFKMRQMNGIRLEKLRGGAQNGLIEGREGQVPLISDDDLRRKMEVDEVKAATAATPTPYKDVLLART